MGENGGRWGSNRQRRGKVKLRQISVVHKVMQQSKHRGIQTPFIISLKISFFILLSRVCFEIQNRDFWRDIALVKQTKQRVEHVPPFSMTRGFSFHRPRVSAESESEGWWGISWFYWGAIVEHFTWTTAWGTLNNEPFIMGFDANTMRPERAKIWFPTTFPFSLKHHWLEWRRLFMLQLFVLRDV